MIWEHTFAELEREKTKENWIYLRAIEREEFRTVVDAREKLKTVALSNHKDGSVAHWFDPYKELMNWVGGGGAKGNSVWPGGGVKDSAFSLGQAETEPSERCCSVNGLTSDAQERFQIETLILKRFA